MARYRYVQPADDVVVEQAPVYVQDVPVSATPAVGRGSGLTGYAVVKYGFILAITIVILYFVAVYVIPLLSNNS